MLSCILRKKKFAHKILMNVIIDFYSRLNLIASHGMVVFFFRSSNSVLICVSIVFYV